jgi:hypothetical protein
MFCYYCQWDLEIDLGLLDDQFRVETRSFDWNAYDLTTDVTFLTNEEEFVSYR